MSEVIKIRAPQDFNNTVYCRDKRRGVFIRETQGSGNPHPATIPGVRMPSTNGNLGETRLLRQSSMLLVKNDEGSEQISRGGDVDNVDMKSIPRPGGRGGGIGVYTVSFLFFFPFFPFFPF